MWKMPKMDKTVHGTSLLAAAATWFVNKYIMYKLMYSLFCFCPQTNTIIADGYNYADQVFGIPQPFGKGGDCKSWLNNCHSGNTTVNFTGTGFTIHREVGVTRGGSWYQKPSFDPLKPEQNGRRFAYGILNVFSRIEVVIFWFKSQRYLPQRVELIINQFWFR